MFFKPQLTAFDMDGEREFHHWHPGSERIATGSQLYSAILNGWQVSTDVMQQPIDFSNARRTSLYHFELKFGSNRMTMPVQENPAIVRFLNMEPFTIIRYEMADAPARVVVNA